MAKSYQSIFEKLSKQIEEEEGIQPHKMSITNDKVDFGFPKEIKETVNSQLSGFQSIGGRGFKPTANQKEDPGPTKQLELKGSSTIQSGAYWPKKEYLIVSFKSGHTYSYSNVPMLTVMLWEQSSSLGSFFYYNIRTSYPYQKMS